MTTAQLILATIALPGLWGWFIGTGGTRWWPIKATTPDPLKPLTRLTDYDI